MSGGLCQTKFWLDPGAELVRSMLTNLTFGQQENPPPTLKFVRLSP